MCTCGSCKSMCRSPGTPTWRCPCGHRCSWGCSTGVHIHIYFSPGHSPSPHMCVPPFNFPSVFCWIQSHPLQFTDEESEAQRGVLLAEKPHLESGEHTLSQGTHSAPLAHPGLRRPISPHWTPEGIRLTLGNAHRTGHLLGVQWDWWEWGLGRVGGRVY